MITIFKFIPKIEFQFPCRFTIELQDIKNSSKTTYKIKTKGIIFFIINIQNSLKTDELIKEIDASSWWNTSQNL